LAGSGGLELRDQKIETTEQKVTGQQMPVVTTTYQHGRDA
jgi:hypothetical protein